MPEQDILIATITPRGQLVGGITSRKRLSASISSRGSLTATITTRGQMSARISATGSLTATISAQGLLVGEIAGVKLGEEEYESYMLVYEDGTELPAVFVENEVVFTATENDIRKDTVAATASGVTVGTKEIPAYHTWEGYQGIPSGSEFVIPLPFSNGYDFTKFQAIICPFSGSIDESVAAEKIAIGTNVYPVQSSMQIGTITKNDETKSVNLGITNDSGILYLIRYFTYKEIY